MSSKRRLIQLAVRDFALPVPRVGSIELHSGYGSEAEDGQAIHAKVQESRSLESPHYRPEVYFRHELSREGYRFSIGGRIDGLYEPSPPDFPHIEEIKTAFSVEELAARLSFHQSHPYCLQLRTYGYFYWMQKQRVPTLSFYLVSTRNGATKKIEVELDLDGVEKWIDRRLDELVVEAKYCEARARRRKRMVKDFVFPFEQARPGQDELIEAVEKGLKEKGRLLIQAPTGLGKTMGVLFPTLKESLGRGQSVIYVTPKNSQHSVAEDAVARFQKAGVKLRSLTITARSKLCLKAEPLCKPEYCEYARDHYSKVAEAGLVELLKKKRKLSARTFRELGEAYQVCPFELQLEALGDAETVICDYNYVFSPHSFLGKLASKVIGQTGHPNLVVDEAHNLFARALGYYSPELASASVEKMRLPVRSLSERYRAEAESLLDRALQTIAACCPEMKGRSARISPPAEPFLEFESLLREFLARYLDSDVEIRPGDPVLQLSFYWSQFIAALELANDPARKEFFTTYEQRPGGGAVKITCCDASEMLRACYDEFEHVVGFSATLKPFDYYAKLSGLDPESISSAEFRSPFPRSKRKLLIIPQISTKYSDRERQYPRVAEAIARIASVRPGNYFVFFPSFEFLDRVYQQFSPPQGFQKLRQERGINAAGVRKVIDHLEAGEGPTIVFAVQGGVFSEGVDYPGETVIGAFVVGPPLPTFDVEREGMREYYEAQYGAGFEYAYAFPAMAKAVQAAGRVIRSETDRGIIVLIDGRFLQPMYSKSMPTDWFEESPTELVSNSLIGDVTKFWQLGD